jgi:hypothetical protein
VRSFHFNLPSRPLQRVVDAAKRIHGANPRVSQVVYVRAGRKPTISNANDEATDNMHQMGERLKMNGVPSVTTKPNQYAATRRSGGPRKSRPVAAAMPVRIVAAENGRSD